MSSLKRAWWTAFVLLACAAVPAKAQQIAGCGVQLSPDAIYRDVPALSNQEDMDSGADCGGTGTYGEQFQCVEYVKRFYSQALHVNVSSWVGNANEYYLTAPDKGLLNFPNNGSVPSAADDILVFDSPPNGENNFGHVAIVKSVDSNFVHIVEQNFSFDGVKALPISFDGLHYNVTRPNSAYIVHGWLRRSAQINQNSVIGGTYFDRDQGLIGTAFPFNPQTTGGTIPALDIQGPGGWNGGNTLTCGLDQPTGIALDRSICWQFIPAVAGFYSGVQLSQPFTFDVSATLPAPQLFAPDVTLQRVILNWTADATALSFLVRVNPGPFSGVITKEQVAAGDKRTATLKGLSLVPGAQYQAVVFAFSKDIGSQDPLIGQFQVSAHAITFTAQ